MAFPKVEAEINALLQIWMARIATYATLYGLTPAQIDQVTDDATLYDHLQAAISQFAADKDELYTYKKNASEGEPNGRMADYPVIALAPPPAPQGEYKPGIEKRNAELYNFLKSHPNRTAESLADLGITATAKTPVDPNTLNPTLKVGAMPDDRVQIAFNKQGMKLCRIQKRLAGGDWMNFIDADESPVIDDTPSADGKPEQRDYRGIYIQKNQTFGQYSPTVTVVTTP